MSESVYFIAIVPPPNIQDEITQLEVLIAERFHSKHALKSPPHITLHMPFKWNNSKLSLLQSAMKKINNAFEKFSVDLNGFSFFESRVIYVNTVKNQELTELQEKVVDICRKDLKLDNANYKDKPFQPHMTIGFRDLRKPQFLEAKKYFEKREYRAKFETNEVALIKYDRGTGKYFPYSH